MEQEAEIAPQSGAVDGRRPFLSRSALRAVKTGKKNGLSSSKWIFFLTIEVPLTSNGSVAGQSPLVNRCTS